MIRGGALSIFFPHVFPKSFLHGSPWSSSSGTSISLSITCSTVPKRRYLMSCGRTLGGVKRHRFRFRVAPNPLEPMTVGIIWNPSCTIRKTQMMCFPFLDSCPLKRIFWCVLGTSPIEMIDKNPAMDLQMPSWFHNVIHKYIYIIICVYIYIYTRIYTYIYTYTFFFVSHFDPTKSHSIPNENSIKSPFLTIKFPISLSFKVTRPSLWHAFATQGRVQSTHHLSSVVGQRSERFSLLNDVNSHGEPR